MKSDHKHHEPDSNAPRDYTDSDIRIKPILFFGVFTAVFTAITFIGVELVFHVFKRASNAEVAATSRFAQERVLPPEPRLQVDERRRLMENRAAEQRIVDEYAWVDKGAGVVRIPVERAVELVAERGLPSRPSQEKK
jgi:hypothetical protein